MFVIVVDVHVKPGHADDFIRESIKNGTGTTTNEPGAFRWDCIQDTEDPNHFILYEAYRDEAAFEEHRKAPHFLAWQEAVADIMVKPRTKVVCSGVYPHEPERWKS